MEFSTKLYPTYCITHSFSLFSTHVYVPAQLVISKSNVIVTRTWHIINHSRGSSFMPPIALITVDRSNAQIGQVEVARDRRADWLGQA
jgi:hypothetical protein